MPLYRISELLSFLRTLEVRPKKYLSQNFLIDGNIVKKIIHVANASDGSVLEIGPGPGVVTEALLNASDLPIYAVETDEVFATNLQRLDPEHTSLQVFHEDFLTFDLSKIPQPIHLVANLPYHLTSPILQKICNHHSLFRSATIMVQKEVGQRICAQPGSKAYGRLSILAQFFSLPKFEFTISNHCFHPRPKAESAVIRLEFKTPVKLDQESFFSMIRLAFSQRRKKLTHQLKQKHELESIEEAFKALSIEPNIRAEQLTLDEFIQLHSLLEKL